jgi:hypothetical protein
MTKKSTAASWQPVAQSANTARKPPREPVVPHALGISSGGILFLRAFCKLLPSPEETTEEAIKLAVWMYCRQTTAFPPVNQHTKGVIKSFPIAPIEP